MKDMFFKYKESRRGAIQFGKYYIYAAVALLFAAGFAQSSNAATFTVTRSDDRNATCNSGVDCSLREALKAADSAGSDDTIDFASGLSLITLVQTDIIIGNNGTLQINGPGANVLTIDGGLGTNRIFLINSNGTTVTINGLSLTGGNGNGNPSGYGGAIAVSQGTLILDSVYIYGNAAPGGGQGGGLYVETGSDAIIRNSTFYNNSSQSCGGISARGIVKISNTTISSNRVTSSGGGLCFIGPQTASDTLRNVTITNNTAVAEGGGISVIAAISESRSANLGNTIVAGNRAGTRPEIDLSSQNHNIISAGNNFIGDEAGDAANTGHPITYQMTDILDTPPVIAQFGFYGGAMPLHALDRLSPAIDRGDNLKAFDPSNNAPLLTDQIGFTRIFDGNGDKSAIVDIGAFELQATQTCVYSLSQTSGTIFIEGGNGSASVITQSGCGWTAQSNVPWIAVTGGSSGSGGGTVSYSVAPTFGSPRTGTLTVAGLTFTVYQIIRNWTPYDFDGDSKADISIYRPSNGEWWILNSHDESNAAFQFGNSSDKIVPGDYTGDFVTDIAVWRPSTGEWFILRSSDFSYYSFPFGLSTDIPAPADYDGDGKTDAAVYRRSNRFWYINRSSDGGTTFVTLGDQFDTPVPADYDGDGKADVAVWHSANSTWLIRKSSTAEVYEVSFGTISDKKVQGDYTGDGKADIAVWRPLTGEWFVRRSEDGSYYSFVFGGNADVPAPADFDNDGRLDAVVYRPSDSNWYVQRSSAGILIRHFGLNSDKPVPNAFVFP
jgi:hypothetical protein